MSYYFLIIPIIVFTVVSQLMIKYGVSSLGKVSFSAKFLFLFLTKALTNIFIVGGLGLSFIAACIWFVVLTKLPLSRIYPFIALSFALVFLLSAHIFRESTTWLSWVGLFLICLGIILIGLK